LASVLAVNELVERVVERLDTADILEDTMLLLTADDDFFLGEHRIRKGKFEVYEKAVRMPLLIRGGGFPAATTHGKFVSNIDLAPAIVDLRAPPPPGYGCSLVVVAK
jgi:N-acetylglucosamine-6-sulfatase